LPRGASAPQTSVADSADQFAKPFIHANILNKTGITMTKEDIQLLYEYDRWANDRVFLAAAKLSMKEFTRDLGGSFHSVRDTLLHIVAGEWSWLEYWKVTSPDSAFLAGLKARREALFNPDAFRGLDAVRLKWAEIERMQIEFVNEITDELLQKLIPFRTTQVKLARLMQHVANHSTYHRGQAALMMRQLNAKPPATDFHEFLVAGDRETGGAH
jgi:uncharacterized damage-inducible protein DinB